MQLQQIDQVFSKHAALFGAVATAGMVDHATAPWRSLLMLPDLLGFRRPRPKESSSG